jgi:methionyl-tRNA formyltransferase
MKVVFFGTPEFAAQLLSYLIENQIEIVGVVTKPDKAQGRSHALQPTPVKLVALSQNPPLPLFQPHLVSAPEFADTLASLQADLFVVVAYGEILKQHLLDMPKYGCINVHASILPELRGAAPIQQSLIQGKLETGITIMQMVRKMDAGDIIRIEKTPINEDMTFTELEDQLCQLARKPLLEVIQAYADNSPPEHYAQDHTLATFAPKIELENCQIDWTQPALIVHNLVRGVEPDPAAWCFVTVKGEKKRLKIFRSKYLAELSGSPKDLLQYDKHGVVIACGQGALQILELQLEGKRRMNAKEFVQGLPHLTLN